MTEEKMPLRDRLILAGISEIEKNGIQGLSMRRVAKDCEVSCAAPYKHFADKHEFIFAIIQYINGRWYARQKEVLERCTTSTRKQLVEISMEYIRFLLENPHFRSIIMLRDEGMEPEHARLKAGLSECTKNLVHKYCKEVGMPEDVERRKTYVVRSLIYGAALMLDNGELERSKENFDFISATIEREFDLP